MLPAREMRVYPPGVEWQQGELWRRTTDEAGEKQKIVRLGKTERLFGLLAGCATKRQAGIDLEPDARSGR
jgi:hypothetical protein